MAKKSNTPKLQITDILRGKFLIDDNASQNWWFLLYLVLLGFLSIRSSHIIDQKSVEIYRLKNELKQKQSLYSSVHKSLMTLQSLGTIKEKAAVLGLKSQEKAPFGILVDSIYIFQNEP